MNTEKIPNELVSMAWILVLGALPPMLDTTIVNIAVNDLANMFSASFVVAQWVVTSYTLALGIAVPFSGWLMRKYDGKKVFMGALTLFLLGSLLCGLAWDMPSLIAFRIIQGFASGILIPTLTSLIVQAAGNQNLGRLMSIVGIPMVFAPILGPVIGGLILQYSTWHWLFFVNLPIGVVSLLLLQWKIPNFKAVDKNAKMDWLGILLLSLISGMIIFGVTQIRGSGSRIIGLSAFAIGGIAFLMYLYYARKKKDLALIPLQLFKSKNFSASFCSLFLAGFATNGPMLLFPLFFQNVRGLDVITAALWLIPQGLEMLLTRQTIGNLTDKIGARFVVLPSIAITIIGTLPFVFFDAGSNQWFIWVVLFIRGIGVGGITVPVMSDSYIGLKKKQQIPAASVATRIIQNVGAAFGSAILATVVSNSLHGEAAVIPNITSAYHIGFLTSLIFMVISIIPALFLTNKLKKPEEENIVIE